MRPEDYELATLHIGVLYRRALGVQGLGLQGYRVDGVGL